MIDMQPLFEAIRSGDLDRVKSLLAADPSLASAKNTSGVSALLSSAYTGKHEIRDVLLAGGPALELHDAAAVGDLSRVRELIEKESAPADAFSPDGFPVVALAAVFGHLGIVRYLASCGANIHTVASNGTGYTALTGAVASGHASIVQWLLEQGMDPNYRYASGYSPLLTAAANGHLEIVNLLLVHGADPNAVTDDRKSATALAAERNHPEVVARLQARAAC